MKLIHVKVIDGTLLSSGDVIHETFLFIEVSIYNHNSFDIFHILRSLFNPLVYIYPALKNISLSLKSL